MPVSVMPVVSGPPMATGTDATLTPRPSRPVDYAVTSPPDTAPRGAAPGRDAAIGGLASDHDDVGAAGEVLARLVRGRRDEQGVLPVQRRKAVPGHRPGHPD